MIEIKFRAWDTVYKEWLFFHLPSLAMVGLDNFLELKNWCQYTGLKDKNGKEIYEGDIVKDSQSDRTGAVYWDYTSLSHLSNKLYRAEVIGNIYENPELLKNN